MRGEGLVCGSAAFAAGTVAYLVYGSSLTWICLTLFVGVLCGLAWGLTMHPAVGLVSIILLSGVFGMVRAELAPRILPTAFEPYVNQSVSLTGVVRADPDVRQKNQQIVVHVRLHDAETNVLEFVPLSEVVHYGEQIRSTGVVSKPAPFQTDTGRTFRYDSFLEKKGIFLVMQKAAITEVSPPRGWWPYCADILFSVKHTFVAGLSRALPDPYAALADGLLTGNQHQLGDALVTTLALSGLIWVVVLSGYHVMVIAEAVVKVFSFLPKRIALVLGTVAIAALIFMTGASAPSLRGGVMAGFALLARGTNRRYDSLRALAITLALILFWNPLLLAYDSGFQLSIVVTPALLFATPLLESKLLWIHATVVREVVAVSIIAQFAVVPLLLWQNGQLGIWAIPANMVVMPLVPIAMLFSALAGIVGVFSNALAPLAGVPAYYVLQYIMTIAKFAVSLPYANATVPEFPFVFVLGTYVLMVWGITRVRTASKST